MANHANKSIFFTIWRAGNGVNSGPRGFLDEDNVKRRIDFWDGVNEKGVFTNILRKDFDIFKNHIVRAFINEQIDSL